MSIIEDAEFEGTDQPELYFGLTAAVGAPLGSFAPRLVNALSLRAYRPELVHLSEFLPGLKLKAPAPPAGADEYTRISGLMDMGNELRQTGGGAEALALLFAAHVYAQRPSGQAPALSGRAFVIRQLKHPEEVFCLRRIYGAAFHLIGVYSPRATRKQYLVEQRKLPPDKAEELMDRDEGEKAQWGQQLRSTFYLSDVFISMAKEESSTAEADLQLGRFLDLLFGKGIISPSVDEYGMYLAQAAAFRSADLSRQVGAAILNRAGDVLSLGTNEVPAAGGGQYWGPPNDHRDFVRGFDSNDRMKREAVLELLPVLHPRWSQLSPDEREVEAKRVLGAIGGTRVMNLTEFGRAVHAEMEALLSGARRGVPVSGASLYTTTFPCHNCAKHIVGAGVARVIYVEPYPKSLARELHDDAIGFAEDGETSGKVRFEPFIGIAPRRYPSLFSMTANDGRRYRRKRPDGSYDPTPLGLRLRASPLSYIDRERLASLAAKRLGEGTTKGVTNG
jgi:deoxycytidylate deaminase